MILALGTLLLSYLLGSVPSGLILSKLCGYGDIRNIGSGNIGATNVLRTGNKKLAALTLLCDFLKGFIPCKLALMYLRQPLFFSSHYLSALELSALVGLAAILGHIFPVWLKFKGGKGVATAIGVIFALYYVLGVGLLAFWLISFYITRISSLSALIAFTATPLISLVLFYSNTALCWCGQPAYTTYSKVTAVITLIIFITHRQNIARLLKGEEHKWSKK